MTKERGALNDYQAVVFDFDGTLADSYAAIASSVNHVRAAHGLPALGVDEVKRYVGRGADYLLTHTIGAGDLAGNLELYRAHHPSVMITLTQLLPGALTLVTALSARGKKIGLCSNKPRLFSEELIRQLGLGHFDVILGPEDVPLPKPAPDMLLLALDRLGLRRHEVLYVGDMLVDIQTARSAGVDVWAVATGSDERRALEDARPDRLLTDLQEIVAEIAAV